MCHRYHGNIGAGNVKPRDLKIKTEIRKKSISMGEEATSRGYSTMWSGLDWRPSTRCAASKPYGHPKPV